VNSGKIGKAGWLFNQVTSYLTGLGDWPHTRINVRKREILEFHEVASNFKVNIYAIRHKHGAPRASYVPGATGSLRPW